MEKPPNDDHMTLRPHSNGHFKDRPNSGHGHVYPRPDKVVMRCGGPHICPTCAFDFVRKFDTIAVHQAVQG